MQFKHYKYYIKINKINKLNNIRKEIKLSIYIGLGKYSNNGAEGLIDGSSDRRAAMEKLTKSVGANLIDYHITRGVYDFCIIVEADTFDMIAAMNLKAKAAGTVSEIDTLEAIDIDSVRQVARSVDFSPPTKD
tara:strand:- start:122 stop:520 length:399 start_codon:yes stop_codon:yes gene_type:complete